MSVNLEAFGLALEDPAAVYGDPRGDRVPFGFELDFYTDRAAYQWPPVTPRYEIPCRVQGEVLVGDEKISVDGWGQRDHSWGAARDWWANQWCWSAGRLEDGTRFHGVGGLLPGHDWGVVVPTGSGLDGVRRERRGDSRGRRGPRAAPGVDAARLLRPRPVGHPAGVLACRAVSTPTDGRLARFPRALARFDAADGRTGGGWIEWNQPPRAETGASRRFP